MALVSFQLSLLGVAIVVAAIIWTRIVASPIRSVPGPFMAKLTNLWKVYMCYRGQHISSLRHLHRIYGPAVRVGPNRISLADSCLINTVYSTKGNFVKARKSPLRFRSVNANTEKGQFYSVAHFPMQPDGRIIENLFSTQDETYHTRLTRPVGRLYFLTSLLAFEPHMDSVIRLFQQRLEQEFCEDDNDKDCDLYRWLLYCKSVFDTSITVVAYPNKVAWDSVSMLTFGRPQGYLENGGDVDGSLAQSAAGLDGLSYLGQIPKVVNWLRYFQKLFQKPPFGVLGRFIVRQIALRRQLGNEPGHSPPDFLDQLLAIQRADPDKLSDDELFQHALNNVAAGGDSSAATMTAIVYNVLKSPPVLSRLQAEIDASITHSSPSRSPVSWETSQKIPYLDAVIQEAIRLHPASGIFFDRIVPEGGLHLPDGRFIPAGAVVGMSPWIVNRDKAVFGATADDFVPERWLRRKEENQADFLTRLSRMKGAILSFSAGKRRCIGRNFALLEIFKVIATLFANFDIKLADPTLDWQLWHSATVRISGVNVKLSPRKRKGPMVR